MNRQTNTRRPGWNKERGEGVREEREQKRGKIRGCEEDKGRRLMGKREEKGAQGETSFRKQEKRWQSGNTGVELKGEDRLIKHQADTGRQRLHQVCFNLCLWQRGSYDPKIILLFPFHMI